jgi:hypothetical protein
VSRYPVQHCERHNRLYAARVCPDCQADRVAFALGAALIAIAFISGICTWYVEQIWRLHP